MKSSNSVFVHSDPKSRSCLWRLFITASLICGVYFIGSAVLAKEFMMIPGFRMNNTRENTQDNPSETLQESGVVTERSSGEITEKSTEVITKKRSEVITKKRSEGEITGDTQDAQSNKCENRCRPIGSEALPEGIVTITSNLEMHPLWGHVPKRNKPAKNLLAIAVATKQKEVVSRIVEKFLGSGFDVMLFHYDGLVDEWSKLGWSGPVIHVSAINQTKWWFAKRFLHPDIVIEYEYIFLWDEDLGVENFNPKRYLAIVKDEGLEISQPAVDPGKSEVHHQITVRRKRERVHRRFYKLTGGGRCDDHSSGPPCVGWVEMMAPVFSRAAWRCSWYMIQNDLIHAWGLDMRLGYCAQGDRATNIGVVDSEYIVHMGLPTLGGSEENKLNGAKTLDHSQTKASSNRYKLDSRLQVRKQSYIEMKIFKERWNNAVKEDTCFVDPYQQPSGQESH